MRFWRPRVSYLYGAMITDILVDESGEPAGIVMANRNGRQAVKAKVVIDATSRSTAARHGRCRICSVSGRSTQVFQRIVAGGEPQSGEGVSVREASVKFYSREGEHPSLPLRSRNSHAGCQRRIVCPRRSDCA